MHNTIGIPHCPVIGLIETMRSGSVGLVSTMNASRRMRLYLDIISDFVAMTAAEIRAGEHAVSAALASRERDLTDRSGAPCSP